MSRTFSSFWISALAALPLAAQMPTAVLSVAEPAKVNVKRTEPAAQVLKVSLKPGYHVNSDKPNDKSLIPLRLTWDAGAVEAVSITYPKPHIEQSDFSEEPLSVFSGDFEIVSKIRRTATAQPGPAYLTGKLRYQACNEKMCLPPRNIDVRVPLLIE
jgi:hypothetical protein